MNFERYTFSKNIPFKKIQMPFGTYYFCDRFVISELQESVHFDWIKAELIIEKIIKFYGKNVKIGFISNRINHFSVDPSNWTKIERKYNIIAASAIVIYNNSNFMNASIEKQFAKKSIKRCMSLEEAILWIKSLAEFN
ncbi:hypothetical protein [Algibacter sp. R77976]|uniref:hypothetical protein n=1 Tax=Algibacter sp. R77976 TaxID=3093873 RepID=UPI0037CCBF17